MMAKAALLLFLFPTYKALAVSVQPPPTSPVLEFIRLVNFDSVLTAEFRLVNPTSEPIVYEGKGAKQPKYMLEHPHGKTWSEVGIMSCAVGQSMMHTLPPSSSVYFAISLDDKMRQPPFRLGIRLYNSQSTILSPVYSSLVTAPHSLATLVNEDRPREIGYDSVSPPVLIHRVEPIYPVTALRAKMEGTVGLELVVDTNGAVRTARLTKSIPAFDNAALVAVQQWRFSPAQEYNQSVSVYYPVQITFALPAQPANKGMNLTARPVTRLAGIPSHHGLERTRARRAPARSAGYARRYASRHR